MFKQAQSQASRARFAGLALGAVLVLASVAAGCGAIAPVTPTPTPLPSATPAPPGFHALVVTHAITGPGTAVHQTEVAAIDPATGLQLWSRALMGNPGPFVPARAGDTVVVSITIPASPYPASQIAAFDIRTGAGLWNYAFSPNTQAFVGTTGASIILVTSAVAPEAAGAANGLIVSALNPANGRQMWQRTVPNQGLFGPMQASGGVVYVLGGQVTGIDTNYTLTAFSAAAGEQLWQKPLGTGSILGALAGNGAYYVGLYPAHLVAAARSQPAGMLAMPMGNPFAASTLTAYRATDGAQLWQSSGFAAPQAETGGMLYTTSAALDNSGRLSFSVLALNSATGSRRWQSSQLGLGDPTSKPFALADVNGVYAFGMPETAPCVHALKAISGTPLWNALENTTTQAAVVGAGSVFTATVPATPAGQPPRPTSVTITALRPTSGAVAWTLVVQQSEAAALILA